MKPVLIALGVSALAMASAAPAQHMGHDTSPQDAHTGHAASREAAQPSDPHAGHQRPSVADEPDDPHAGHSMGSTEERQTDPHAGHAMPGMVAKKAPPTAPPPPEAFTGPENAAETIYDPALFRRKREEALIEMHGGFIASMLLLDRLEYRIQDGRDGYAWEGEGWYGGDYDKLWVKTEGEGAYGDSPEQAEIQALYSRAVDPWFNLQAGIRHDFRAGPERTHLALGIQGLAPYWFEVDGQLFLSDEGEVTARLEAEYDQRITQRLILQPAVELDLSAQDIPELGLGAGLSSIETGLRLRYEVVPEFAPYVGVEYERKLGDTADFARASGEEAGGWAFLIGLRSWF